MFHSPGSQNLAADTFSRERTDAIESKPFDDEIPTFSTLLVVAAEKKDEQQPILLPYVPGQRISRGDYSASTETHVIHHIVSYHFDKQTFKYKVPWYGYGTADDTYGLIEHLPRNYIVRFWRRTTGKPTSARTAAHD